ncbi:phage tail protein I [Acetomicrobium sp. S15 = DSM 107314]|uniref:phage tail protein I n=1 Tax=Acetomicrobium sp. S15 = DSM 107314 TaxID=2529858 RepID=UPI0018E0E16F|nr:phage tail protein I [Acetomicrobium sp. S15 = DSM 107314]
MTELDKISLLEILPESLTHDKEIQSTSAALDVSFRDVFSETHRSIIIPEIDILTGNVLDLLAWQFHVDLYDSDWDDETKRNMIIHFVAWHRLKGTKTGILSLLSSLGYKNVELFEYHEVRQAYINAGILFADGTWDVAYISPRIISRSIDVAGLPDIPHWANFSIKLDLAEMANHKSLSQIRWAIEEMKPVRAWPLYFYVLAAEFNMQVFTKLIMESLYAHIQAEEYYPWCRLMIDGSWFVGPDPKPYMIDKNDDLVVNGSWNVGELIFFKPIQTIYPCMAQGHLIVIPHIAIIGHPMALAQDDRMPLRVDGSWIVGHANMINAVSRNSVSFNISANLQEPQWTETHRMQWEWEYAKTPQTLADLLINGQIADGAWIVGASPFGITANGSWYVGLDPLRSFGNLSINSQYIAPVGGILVGYDNVSIDGSWNVGDAGPRATMEIMQL